MITGEDFYMEMARRLDAEKPREGQSREDMLREEPPAIWIAALIKGVRDGGRGKARSPKVSAYLNEGRWLADCPFCNSAVLVTTSDSRFFCPDCLNAEAEEKYLPLTVPSPQKRGAITTDLLNTPRAEQNWRPD